MSYAFAFTLVLLCVVWWRGIVAARKCEELTQEDAGNRDFMKRLEASHTEIWDRYRHLAKDVGALRAERVEAERQSKLEASR